MQGRDLTLDKLLQLARAMEAANWQENVIEGNGGSNNQVNKDQYNKLAKKTYNSNKQSMPDPKSNKPKESVKPKGCDRCGSATFVFTLCILLFLII